MITIGCKFGYDGSKDWLLEDVTLNISYNSQMAIVEKNGTGKSTLLNILSGNLVVNRGEFYSYCHPNVKVAHISQYHIEHLGSYICT